MAVGNKVAMQSLSTIILMLRKMFAAIKRKPVVWIITQRCRKWSLLLDPFIFGIVSPLKSRIE